MKYSVIEVFTPTRPARLTFVERDSVNDQLVDSLRTPGKQVVVYGPSGSGKTTLLVNKLNQIYETHVTVRCVAETTFSQVLARAFDHLGAFIASSKTSKSGNQSKVNFSAEYAKLKAEVEASADFVEEETRARTIALQITPERLAEFLGMARACLVLEDFHKMSTPEKVRVAQAMKVFMDMADSYPDVRLVLIGAVDTAREVIEYDREMHNRVSEVRVPLMDDQEIRQVLVKGEALLNVIFHGNLKSEISRYANGVASVAHQLGLNLCFAANIAETCDKRFEFDTHHLESAIARYVQDSADTLKAAFGRALRRERIRRFDNTRLILTALADSGADGARHSELLAAIRKIEPDYPSGNLTNYLLELQCQYRGGLIRYEADSGRYAFSNPLYFTYALLTLSSDDRARREAATEGELSKILFATFIQRGGQSWMEVEEPEKLIAWMKRFSREK